MERKDNKWVLERRQGVLTSVAGERDTGKVLDKGDTSNEGGMDRGSEKS